MNCSDGGVHSGTAEVIPIVETHDVTNEIT